MVNKMDELDTSKINPLTHPIDNTQNLREDIEKKDIEREKLQAAADIAKQVALVIIWC